LKKRMTEKNSSNDKISVALTALRDKIAQLDAFEPKHEWISSTTDSQCTKFLVGHDFDVEKAFDLMCKCSTWRLEYKTKDLIERVESETCSQVHRFAKAYFPMGVIGKDNEGRSVVLNHLAAVDFPKILAEFGLENALEYAIYVQEKSLQTNSNGQCVVILHLGISDHANPPVTSILEIRTWISAMLKFIQPLSAIVDPYYPESNFKIFFTEAPAMFWATWAIAKNFVNERTREKVEVLTTNSSKRILECLPKDVVPTFLGGTNKLQGMGRGGKLQRGQCGDAAFIEQLDKQRLQ
jgi:hypothetical protein